MKTGTQKPLKPLKVYLCGAHCVGKSTLARWISCRFQLPHIAEVARTELAKLEITFDQLRVNVDLTSTYQRNVFAAQLEAERGRSRFVADRAFLDNLAYLGKHARGLHDVLKSPACREAADEMRAGVRQGTTLVFFVRPHAQLLRGDGFRAESDLDVAGVWAIDGAVQFMLEMWDIDYIPIESFSFKERQRTVEALLRGK